MARTDVLEGSSIPFVEAYHTGKKQRPTAIVLRTSFTTGDPGAALAIAQAWHVPMIQADSCHYVIDDIKVFRCLPDKMEAVSKYTPRFHRKSIVINVCHNPPLMPSSSIVSRTSRQVARLCRLYRIRRKILTEDEQERWIAHPWRHRGGIIVANVGDFPTNRFFDSVMQEYKKFD